eukprot:CAMPEP_0206607318 /NCGR_PEP_ID=MMETSP0325_2-20121206/52062_1 /ASSEMBLY_ACC=CAM_ASM_000347 /TAXON_ID=2866 /ORGANISM="Crypthecodinium cohnii, Strain Seligo" /LENGTH=339 /DNA_ID=CAMNT_0054124275 /DNA_START=231 /DNA_END=1246 /DNA_ORIENTATION=-
MTGCRGVSTLAVAKLTSMAGRVAAAHHANLGKALQQESGLLRATSEELEALPCDVRHRLCMVFASFLGRGRGSSSSSSSDAEESSRRATEDLFHQLLNTMKCRSVEEVTKMISHFGRTSVLEGDLLRGLLVQVPSLEPSSRDIVALFQALGELPNWVAKRLGASEELRAWMEDTHTKEYLSRLTQGQQKEVQMSLAKLRYHEQELSNTSLQKHSQIDSFPNSESAGASQLVALLLATAHRGEPIPRGLADDLAARKDLSEQDLATCLWALAERGDGQNPLWRAAHRRLADSLQPLPGPRATSMFLWAFAKAHQAPPARLTRVAHPASCSSSSYEAQSLA